MKALGGKLFKTFLDLFLPRRESTVAVEALASSAVTQVHASEHDPEFGEALLNYRDKEIRDLLWEFKFYRNRKALDILADILYEHLVSLLSEELLPDRDTEVILIPIPSSKKRSRSRGYDPLRALVEKTVKKDESGIFKDGSGLLVKVRETRRQTEIKNRDERLKNVVGAFRVAEPNKLKDKRVFVIDDITTTGATLREADRALREAGAKEVRCVALAH